MADAPPPGLPDDPSTSFFWEGARAGELRILRCQDCGRYIHLPRPICNGCQSFDLAAEPVSGKATLYSYSITHKPFHPFFVDRVPYAIATVTLPEQDGLQLLTMLTGIDADDIEIGMDLEVAFETLGDDLVVPAFTNAGGAS